MAAQQEGRKNRRRCIGGLDQPATAQRFRSTLDYIDMSPYNPSETSTLDVEINPPAQGIYLATWRHHSTAGDCISQAFMRHGRRERLGLRGRRRPAALGDTERRLARVGNAVATSRRAGPPLPGLGTRLRAFARAGPMCSPEEGWAVW
jgi:hypothetical protein